MTEECEHNWQPTNKATRGRFKCCKCFVLGYRESTASMFRKNPTDEIIPYKKEPKWVEETPEFSDYDPFYTVGDSGRCPSMEEQERQLFDFYDGSEEK